MSEPHDASLFFPLLYDLLLLDKNVENIRQSFLNKIKSHSSAPGK